RRGWLEHVDGFDDSLPSCEDWDLWLRLALAGCKLAWSQEVVCAYRVHANNMSRNVDRMRDAELRVLQKAFSGADLPPELHALRRPALAQVYFRTALRKYVAGEASSGRGHLEQALEFDPGLLDLGGRVILDAVTGWAR